VDLPSLLELDNGDGNKLAIALIGQDPKTHDEHEQLHVGTPYGLHHKDSRETLPGTKLYFDMVHILLELGYRVYLTDVFKIWVCNPKKRYDGLKLPYCDQKRFLEIIKPELDVVKPVAVITWGKVAGDAVGELKLGIKHLKFPHPSSAAGGAWKSLMKKTPTRANKLAYWRTEMEKMHFDITSKNSHKLL
jgi:uracil-DNA glycosylase